MRLGSPREHSSIFPLTSRRNPTARQCAPWATQTRFKLYAIELLFVLVPDYFQCDRKIRCEQFLRTKTGV